jgi:hypothetical protein
MRKFSETFFGNILLSILRFCAGIYVLSNICTMEINSFEFTKILEAFMYAAICIGIIFLPCLEPRWKEKTTKYYYFLKANYID